MASLEALAWEAHRRGITYGKLTANLTPQEESGIAARYKAHQREVKKLAAKRRRRSGECSG